MKNILKKIKMLIFLNKPLNLNTMKKKLRTNNLEKGIEITPMVKLLIIVAQQIIAFKKKEIEFKRNLELQKKIIEKKLKK